MTELEAILIVGGGIAGLTLGRPLHMRGFKAEIIECSREWRAEGGGIMAHAKGMCMLRALGSRWSGLETGSASGGSATTLAKYCARAISRRSGATSAPASAERSSLQGVLVAGIEGVPRRLGTSIPFLTQHKECVAVDFTDGSSRNYGMVVGADGISSTVRALTLSGMAPIYTGAMAWLSVPPIRPRGLTSLQFLFGQGHFFGFCPIGDGRTYGFGNITSPRVPEPFSGRLERLRHRFSHFGGVVQEYLSGLTCDKQIHCGPIDWVALEQWYSRHVVLIGDAAHASPQ